MTHALCSPREAETLFAMLLTSSDAAQATLSVSEELVLSAPLDIGVIQLQPENGLEDGASKIDSYRTAVRYGFYDWHTRPLEDLYKELCEKTAVKPEDDGDRKLRRSLLALASAWNRLGLTLPTLDADAVSNMPFRSPTTIVADTSAIQHGGIDFAVRFLHPAARIKIPAISHMEIHNEADRFLSQRRAFAAGKKAAKKSNLLYSHVVSQGGQRALLRLELLSDVEIERAALFSDPLRYAFVEDKDVKDLNLSVPMRSYCDRLILETVRQHQTHVNVGHPVIIMTGDQGMARMALAEGIQPLFFEVPQERDISGDRLPGTRFNPFSGELYSVPLSAVIWEMAVTFGAARLAVGNSYVEVTAIGRSNSWQPFHSRDDLLWVAHNLAFGEKGEIGNADAQMHVGELETALIPQNGDTAMELQTGAFPPTEQAATEAPLAGLYKFSLIKMIPLAEALALSGRLTIQEAAVAAGVSTAHIRDYTNYLTACRLASTQDDDVVASGDMVEFWKAIESEDFRGMRAYLLRPPSLTAIAKILSEGERQLNQGRFVQITKRSNSTYRAIFEALGLALWLPDIGIIGTPEDPTTETFFEMLLESYGSLTDGDPIVSSGALLEKLATDHGLHPLVSREKFRDIMDKGLVSVSAHGASPDRRFDNHSFREITNRSGRPTVEEVHLYRGTFLFADQPSVDIRLERKLP